MSDDLFVRLLVSLAIIGEVAILFIRRADR